MHPTPFFLSVHVHSDQGLPKIVTVVLAAGPAAVPLGSAGTFVILAKSGVSTVPQSIIGAFVHTDTSRLTYGNVSDLHRW